MICGLIFLFLIVPIMVIIPLSFNAEPYFTFTKEMLIFDPAGYSLRWYHALFGSRGVDDVDPQLLLSSRSRRRSSSTTLGTLAALGL